MPYLVFDANRRRVNVNVCSGVVNFMAGTHANDWRFPSPCPVCHAATGTPFGTQTDADKTEVFVRCPECYNVWKLSSERQTIVLKAKPDRRQS